MTNKERSLGAAEAGQSNYHQVQDNLYRITDHNTRSAGDRILRFNYKIYVSAQVAMEDITDLIYICMLECNERHNLVATVIRLNYKSVSVLSGFDQHYFNQTFLLNIITSSEYQIRNNVKYLALILIEIIMKP